VKFLFQRTKLQKIVIYKLKNYFIKGELMMEPNEIREENNKRIKKIIEQFGITNFEDAVAIIPSMLTKKELEIDDSAYTCADEETYSESGVNRFLMFDNPNKENPFSIWIFSFAPHQKTKIHDHKYECSVSVLSKHPITEKFFHPTGQLSKTHIPLAKRINSIDRYRFHTNCDRLSKVQPHQLKNTKHLGEGTSITMHIYHMEAHLIKDGIELDNRNLNIIYQKEEQNEEINSLKF
jgi:predicted metal-dependent enzyme (double-stranded beta helix superfamily)